MKRSENFKLKNKMLRTISSVVLSMVLTVTSLNTNGLIYAKIDSPKKTIQITDASGITQGQRAEAKKEDEKVKKKLKETKESKEKNKKATVVKELKELRTADSTTYLLSDGSRKLEMYGQDIRYKEDGKYVDYNPELKELSKAERKELKEKLKNKEMTDDNTVTDYAYVNKAGDAKQYFPKKLGNDNSIVLTKKNHIMSFAPVVKTGNETDIRVDANTETENDIETESALHNKNVNGDKITYSDDTGKISYQYTSLTNGVKENIILKERPEENIFEFELNLPGMKLEQSEYNKELRIINKKTNNIVAYINEPNIKDADGKVTYNEIYYDVEKVKSGEYILKVVVDKDYLYSENAKYPIVIDPYVWWVDDRLETVSVSDFPYTLDINRRHGSIISIHNKGIKFSPYSESEDTCYIDTSGIDMDNGMFGSTSTFYGSDIQEAYLSITEEKKDYQIGGGPTAGYGTFTVGTIEVRSPVSTWNPNTITWNNHPKMGKRVWSQFQCTGVADTEHQVDLKDWAQAVANREIENTGLALKAVEEGTGMYFYSSSFKNANYMSLTIVYENPHIGEKDIYTYEDFNTPNGQGRIELSQGNFLYMQSDLGLPTPQLGLGINRTYNSRNTESSNFGIGWTCEYDSYVVYNGAKSLVYADGTGAFYTFIMQKGATYVCNENLDLSVEEEISTQTRVISATDTQSSSTVSFTSKYIIRDKNNIKRYFDEKGRLRLIEEANGTFIYVKYHDIFGLIESVHSSKGQKLDFVYAYSGGDYFISQTILEDGSSFTYNYTNKRLSKVIHTGNEEGKIEYNYSYNANGQLSEVIDATGQTYRIEYDGKSVSSAIYPNNERIDVYINYESLKTRVYTKNANNMVLHYEEYEFDTSGQVLKKTNDLGNVSEYSYDRSLVTNTKEEVQYHELQNGIVKTINPTTDINKNAYLETEMQYDNNDNIVSETDEEGNVTEYTYGDSRHPDLETKIKVTSAGGEVIEEITYVYDDKGNLIKETDSIEKTVTAYTYDGDGNVTESTETLVDENSNLSNVDSSVLSKGLKNVSDESTYDIDGNTLTSNVSSGTVSQTETNTYDTLGRIKTSTDEKGIISEYSYDEFGRNISVTTTIPGNGSETSKTTETTESVYDLNGRVTKETDKLGRITTYSYDNMGRVISQTFSYGNESRTTTTTYGYEDNFYVITGTGANKRLPTVYTVTEKNANNETVVKTYTDAYGQTVREESNGIITDYTYDKQGNTYTTYTRGSGSTNPATPKLVVYVYDKNGRLTDTIQNPVYRNGAFTVDATNSIVTSNKYDESGNLTEETDAKGNKTTYEYNEEGKLTKVSLQDGTGTANDTLYAYDIQNKDVTGNIISTKDTTTNALGAVTETVMNGAGQVLSVTDKFNTDLTTTYEYDMSGNKTKETFANGNYVIYVYDKKNLLISKLEKNADNVWLKLTSYTYNSDDLITKICDYKVDSNTPRPYRYTFYEYDGLNRMVGYSEVNTTGEPSEAVVNEHKTVYKYDIEDKLIEIRYPKTADDKLKGIKLEYNSYKWLVGIKGIISVNGTEVTRSIREYEYFNDSRVKTIKEYRGFLNGTGSYIRKSYEYDVFDRVTKMSYADSTNLNLLLEQYAYSYDKNSNITSETIINNYPSNQAEKVNETRVYTYDNLNRLATSKITDNVTNSVHNTAYTYDKVGNRTRITTEDTVTYYYYNKLNRLDTIIVYDNNVQGIIVQTVYKYDKNGNQISETKNMSGEKVTNEYDVNNQLTKSVETKSGETLYTQINTYNDLGQRISKTDNGVTTYYYYQGGILLYTTDATGNKTSQNIVGPQDNIIATIRYDNGQHAYFYNKDIRTSVTNVVDESGKGVVSYKYDDYGTTTMYGNTDFYNEICYTSGVYDDLTSLYYLNARYYNPSTAAFITQDSYRGEQKDYNTWNLYAYCGGNPINYVDSSGHWLETVLDIGSIGISSYDLITSPSWANLGNLAWDIGAAALPFIPGSYTAKGVKAVSKAGKAGTIAKAGKVTVKVADKVSDLKKAKAGLTVGKYKTLRKAFKGYKGIEGHHIIEKRLRKAFHVVIKEGDMISVPLSKEVHKIITQRWRKAIKYGTNYKKLTKTKIRNAIEQVYYDMPDLKEIAKKCIEEYYRK